MSDTILTPGKNENFNNENQQQNPEYLIKSNFLGEFKDEEKSTVRSNLGVLASENTYTKEQAESVILNKIEAKFREYSEEIPEYLTEEDVAKILTNFVRIDGTTPFTSTQKGKAPEVSSDLTTKQYVDTLISNYLKKTDKDVIINQIKNILLDYVKQEDVYTKEEVYKKEEIDSENKKYTRLDGTTPFTAPQSGRTPQTSSHLTTKGYVDTIIQNHKIDIDPHNFTERLNKKLEKYALKNTVYDITQTYSRNQIDSVIEKLVEQSVIEIIKSHESLEDPHNILEKIKESGYVTKDGTTPFEKPQKGVDAVNPKDLVTLHQLKDLVQKESQKLNDKIDDKECTWITSGPVKSTVGFVENETELAKNLSLQEIMDAIFYGKGISINVPSIGRLGQTVDVTVCVQGTLANLDYAELYQDGVLIGSFIKSDFEKQGCIVVESKPINSDSKFIFKVYYVNGATHEVSAIVKVALPVFIGLLPKWKFGNVVTYEYLLDLYYEDQKNNMFYDYSKNIKEVEHKYNFEDTKLQHVFMAIPSNYPDLYQMCTSSQQFGKDAFDIIDLIPFQVPGASSDIVYKLYIYKQALASLNIPVTFKFETE